MPGSCARGDSNARRAPWHRSTETLMTGAEGRKSTNVNCIVKDHAMRVHAETLPEILRLCCFHIVGETCCSRGSGQLKP
jgi:hypothetical protein